MRLTHSGNASSDGDGGADGTDGGGGGDVPIAMGSAAGGAWLTLTGGGLSDEAASMRVSIHRQRADGTAAEIVAWCGYS